MKHLKVILLTAAFTLCAIGCARENIEKITIINGAVPAYKFSIPKGDSIGNYTKFSAQFLADNENYPLQARVRAYGAYPAELFKDLGDIVFLNFNEGDADRNGPYLLSNVAGSNISLKALSNSAGPYSWFTLEFPLHGMRHPRYENENFPGYNEFSPQVSGDLFFALGLGTANTTAGFTYYVKNVTLQNDDGSKKILSKGSGFNKPAFAGYLANVEDVRRASVKAKDVRDKSGMYEPGDYFLVRQIYPWLYSIFDPQSVYAYLIVGSERAVLYDTGYGIGNLNATIKKITNKPFDVVVSHGHGDHINGAYQFEEAWLHEDDFEIGTRGASQANRRWTINNLAEMGEILPDGFDPEAYVNAGAGNLKKLSIGQVYNLGDMNAEVIAMEGHTAGSIGLFVKEQRVIFVSDAASNHVWLFLNESLPISRYIAMLERTLTLEFDTAFSGHSDAPTPKQDYHKFISVARNATMENSQPYRPEMGGVSYQEDGVLIAFREDKLR